MAAVLASVLTVLATLLAAAHSQADVVPAPLTVSRPDTVGYPDVDLILGGVPGLGIGKPPAVDVTQSGQALRTTTSWDLSADHPIAVVVDAPAGKVPQAQGLVAELVQDLPPQVPLSLASAAGAAGKPGLDRDTVMAALAHLKAGTPTTVHDGIAAASASGVQHVFVVSACGSPAPSPAPAGVVVDLLGIGAACTGGWPAVATSGAGTFTAASNFATGLAALDVTVARWRSSLVVVTQAVSRDPLVLAVADDQVTAVLPGAATTPRAATPAPGTGSPATTSPDASSGSGRTGLVLALVLLIVAALVVAMVMVLRRRAGQTQGPRDVRTSTDPVLVPELATPLDQPASQDVRAALGLTDAPAGEAGRPLLAEPVVVAAAAALPHQREEARPAVIDLRDEATDDAALPEPHAVDDSARDVPATPDAPEVGAEEPADEPVDEPVDVDAVDLPDGADDSADARAEVNVRDVQDEPSATTRMAVATRQGSRKGESTQPAAVAELATATNVTSLTTSRTTSVEEPVTVAEQTPHPTDETHAAPPESAPEAESVESVDAAAVEGVAAEEILEPVVVELDAASSESAETSDDVDNADDADSSEAAGDASEGEAEEPVEDVLARMPRSEFQWSKLEFTPLEWRYDQEPEAIDLREGSEGSEDSESSDEVAAGASATVDLRGGGARNQPRRKRARR